MCRVLRVAPPCRSVMLSRQRISRLLLRFHENRPLRNEKKVLPHSHMFLAGSLDSLEGDSILETTKTRRLSLYHHAPPKSCPRPIFRTSDDFSCLGKPSRKPVLFLTLSIKGKIEMLELKRLSLLLIYVTLLYYTLLSFVDLIGTFLLF